MFAAGTLVVDAVTGSLPSIASSHNRLSSSDRACKVYSITKRGSLGITSKQKRFSIDSVIRRVHDLISIVSVVVCNDKNVLIMFAFKVGKNIGSYDFPDGLSVWDHGENAVLLGILAVMLRPCCSKRFCK